jgi:hypothetical protein
VTEASTSETLTRAVALCAMALRSTARTRLLKLLPENMAAGVEDWLRDPAVLAAGATSAVESALLARSMPVDDDDDGDDDDSDMIPTTGLPEALLACLLAVSPKGEAAALLARLPLYMQGEVMALLATSTSRSILRPLPGEERDILAVFCRQLVEGQWGVYAACDVLRALSGQRRLRRALVATAEVDAEAAAIIQSHLFDFDDLTRLRTQELQRLLSRINNLTLARALTDSGETVSGRIFANVSSRRTALLRDEIELCGELEESEIEAARNEVMAVIRMLYERGEIITYFGSIRRGDEVADDDYNDDEDEDDEGAEQQDNEEQEAASRPGDGEASNDRRRLLALLVAAMGLIGMVALLLSDRDRAASDQSQARPGRAGVAGASRNSAMAVAGSTGQQQARRSSRDAPTVDAIVEFPNAGGARVAVGPGSDVERLPIPGEETDKAKDEAARLYLRVGRVTVTTGEAQFTVGTPMGEVTGAAGSSFAVRVVLDATTTVSARHGTVEVRDRGGRLIARLTPGRMLRLDSSGGAELSR